MSNTNPRNFLFLTNFTEPCFRTIPAVADWIGNQDCKLTILHVYDSRRRRREREGHLQSFFAEADRYLHCERKLLEGNPASVLQEYVRRTRHDIVFAPACEPTGLPRLGHRSMRATLLRKTGVHLWTAGAQYRQRGWRPIENVVYILTGHRDWPNEAMMAANTAARWNAQFHLICLIPPQEVHDGTMPSDIYREHPAATTEQLREVGNRLPVPVAVHTSTGNERIEMIRLLQECTADVVFLGEHHVIQEGLFGTSIRRDLEDLGCSLICLPKKTSAVEGVTAVEPIWQPSRLLPEPQS